MAQFCSKCGQEVTPGQQFCATCGTPVATEAVAVPYAQPVPVAPVKSGGNTALKVILIVVAVIVGLGVLGLGAIGYTAWRVSRAIHVNGSNGQVTMHTSEGDFSANTNESFSASELGTEVYPGAAVVKGGMRMSLPTGSMVAAIFTTSDSREQVIAFYKSKMGSEAAVIETPGAAVLSVKKGDQETVSVTITNGESQHPGKTMIHITHSISKKGN